MKQALKKTALVGTVLLMLSSINTIQAKKVEVSVPIICEKGENLIPIRKVAETLGAKSITWNKKEHILSMEVDYKLSHLYLSYLNGLEETNREYVEPLPPRLRNMELPPYPLKGRNGQQLEQRPITLELKDGDYSASYAVYDYKIADNTLYLGEEWLNTIFLADSIKIQSKDKFQVQYLDKSELEEEVKTLEGLIKPTTAEEAIALWSRGQQTRSGALQYSALSEPLQKKVMEQFSGWVTGGSSPSLGKLVSQQAEVVDEGHKVYTLQYDEMLQGKVSGHIQQKVFVEHVDQNGKGFWLITGVEGDTEYYSLIK